MKRRTIKSYDCAKETLQQLPLYVHTCTGSSSEVEQCVEGFQLIGIVYQNEYKALNEHNF